MYDELVKKIRHCATDPMHCLSCGEDKNGRCFKRLMTQAADAIEDLEFAYNSYEKDYKDLCAYLPHWIPSKDCLPVNGEEVITLGPNGGMECGFYRGLCGTKKDKWEWKKHTVRTVKYWMPRKALPKPPKEET